MSFGVAILRRMRGICVGWRMLGESILEEVTMIDQVDERDLGRECWREDREWTGWPFDIRANDVRQRALEVIATTRCDWASCPEAPSFEENNVTATRFEHPLFSRALRSKKVGAGRPRANRTRSRNRA